MNIFTAQQVKTLNELEMLVYQYVAAHPNTVPYMRIRELASEAHVSTTTVLHFCKKVGCDGYAQFKAMLKEQTGSLRSTLIPDSLNEVQAFFEQANTPEYQDLLDEAAAYIAKAERVFIVGIGNSGGIAAYGARYFSNIGKFAVCITAGWLHYANGLHLGEELTKRTGLPVSVMNDAKAAGLAEAAWGFLSDCKDSVVILIGSGIGGALIKDGKVHFGRHGSAGEFSNIALSENVDMPGSLWYAQNGTPRLVQMVAGAKGIPADQLNGRILFEQANAGDPVVLAALDRFTRGIALQIFNLQMIYDPEKFAIGGGISRQKLFLESIQKNLDELYTIYPEKSFPRAQLTTCRFFNEANLYGAYRFFIEREKA